MIVYFLRHASAGERKSSPEADEKRPLDKDGIGQCGIVGRALAAMDVHADAIISSPLKRATQTASLVANELAYEDKIHIDDALRPEASYGDFRDLLQRYSKKEAIIVVGHNPNLSEFAGRVVVRGPNAAGIDLKKGAVARIEVDQKSGTLTWCLTPKLLRAVYETSTLNSRPKTSRK